MLVGYVVSMLANMAETGSFTRLEVAALADADEDVVRADAELGIGGPSGFSLADLVYFRLVSRHGVAVGNGERSRVRAFVESVMKEELGPTATSVGAVTAGSVLDVAREMCEKLERFTAWKGKLSENPRILSGDTVFPRTRTSVRHIGRLILRGIDDVELREDYPHLNSVDFELAKVFARAYPRTARQRAAAS